MIRYTDIRLGKFIDRPNRFISHVEINGKTETVHVKNTGRCKELLIPGATVSVQYFDKPERKTKWDLIGVEKKSLGWINIDSQIPNKVVWEWLKEDNKEFNNITLIKPEYKYGNSRVDFYVEDGDRKALLEVKGCTLENDGMGYFPDAPTERGRRHLNELSSSIKDGYEAYLVYCIAMNGIKEVYPNEKTDPKYAECFRKAVNSGVKVIYLQCDVTSDSIGWKEY
ncbi:DNA/RNA nuclease SfsA [Howardella ureilytica]|nr:DNA/RNA nuclease SfsA [Lachnospiraceae bacterium]MDY2956104.1 DNA/RNA nuclease SfsA [Lachnospiraceae bacterium]